MTWLESMREFTFFTALLRLLLAALTGMIIGSGQTRRGRAAGMRTYMLVSIGAALTVLISTYLFRGFETFWAPATVAQPLKFDGSRYAAGVIAGIGFLAAGSIIGIGRQQVSGLAGAVGLFVTACLGLAAGAGFYEGLIPGLVIIALSMELLRSGEARLRRKLKNVTLYVAYDAPEDLLIITDMLQCGGVRVFGADDGQDASGGGSAAILHLRLGGELHAHSEVLTALAELPCVRSVQELVEA